MLNETNEITHYFPNLQPFQLRQFSQLQTLYPTWNEKINVISRKDIHNLEVHHILHSLAIAKIISFTPGTKVMDAGTGGGFPGIPLAIMFPEVQFTLVDSIAKKIKVVAEIAAALELKNVTPIHERVEKVPGRFDFIVSRAVTALPRFLTWTKGKIGKGSQNSLANGILYLKGGDIDEELKDIRQPHTVYKLSKYFEEEFFDTKKLVHIEKL